MRSHITRAFRGHFSSLPEDIRGRAVAAFRRFQNEPNLRGLDFKLVNSRHAIWSARVSDDYRVLGKRNGNDIWWFWIGRHAEYERLLDQL